MTDSRWRDSEAWFGKRDDLKRSSQRSCVATGARLLRAEAVAARTRYRTARPSTETTRPIHDDCIQTESA